MGDDEMKQIEEYEVVERVKDFLEGRDGGWLLLRCSHLNVILYWCWWGLVLGANLGGCLTPIGSPSSIIALGVAEQEGQPIPMGKFFRMCFGVTVLHLVISTLYLHIVYSLL